MTTLGMMGLGVMGAPMAHNFLEAGYPLVVHNRSRAAVERLERAGATPATSPAEVAERSDIIVTCLPDEPDVEAVYFGDMLDAVRPGQLTIDMTTSSATLARQIFETYGERDVQALDAPVSGGEVGAQRGNLTIMVGGTAEAFARSEPILDVVGSRATHVGGAGSGQVAKSCNQIIVGATITAVAEALLLAECAGVDPAAVRAALRGGFADSRVLELHGRRMIEDDLKPGFRARLHQKDLRLTLDLAASLGLALPETALVAQLLISLVGAGDGDADHAALRKALERLSGL